MGRLRQQTSFEFNVSQGYIAWTSQVRVTQTLGGPIPLPAKKKKKEKVTDWHIAIFLRSICFLCSFPVPTVPCSFLLASTSWMPSQRCSARSHAGSQRPCNSAQGKLLHGWIRWWLLHLVRNRGHFWAGKTLQTFSISHNVIALVILTGNYHLDNMFLGCLSGV